MLTKTLIIYAATVVAAIAVCFCIVFSFKIRKRKLSVLHMIFGAVGFAITLTLVLVLAVLGFSQEVVSYVIAWINPAVYKIAACALFFLIISIARYFILNFIYFNRDKCDEGESFLAGYGFCGAFIVAFYSIFIFIWMLVVSSGNKLVETAESNFVFSDGSVIPAFENPMSLIFIVIVFAVYTALCIIIAEFMTQHASLPYKKSSTFTVFIITALCEMLMCCTFFFTISRIPMLAIVIIIALIVALAAAAVIFLYKYKETLPYIKQFDD